jgi:hypothetical protein
MVGSIEEMGIGGGGYCASSDGRSKCGGEGQGAFYNQNPTPVEHHWIQMEQGLSGT